MDRELAKKLGWELVGQCGVDSGFMMLVDPTYVLNEKDYQKLGKLIELGEDDTNTPIFIKNGIVTSTYLGDGNYHVYIQKNKKSGRVERMMIDFTVTYGYTDSSKIMHDIDMDELLAKLTGRKS